MNKILHAISLDVSGNYENAVVAYHQLIQEGNATVEIFTNLAFLYWEAVTQFSFSNGREIPETIRNAGIENHQMVLQEGLQKFPESSEMHFWKRYFRHRGLFEEFSDSDCIVILNRYGSDKSLIPYFFLYLFDKEKYKNQREKLLELCNACPTAKNNWIKTIIG